MAYFYVDANTGTDSLGNGGSWAAATATLIYLLDTATVNPAAGDVVYVRANASETVPDTAASPRTITSPGTTNQPLRVIGVKTGTTNTGASVVAADLAVRSGDQPVIECTGAGNDMNIDGSIIFYGIHFICPDRFQTGGVEDTLIFHQCSITTTWVTLAHTSKMEFDDCELILTSGIRIAAAGILRMLGGEITGTITNLISNAPSFISIEFIGVDLSGATITNLIDDANTAANIIFRNCRHNATNEVATALTAIGRIELIGCNNTATKSNTGSYQDYYCETPYGIVVNDPTIVRTGGADDGADGSFSCKLTPHANAVLEGSAANLESPWFRVWVAGGSSITATVYTTHDNAGTLGRDLYRHELWCEFYTPDASDTAQHDQTYNHATDFILDNTDAAGTDDVTSTWVTYDTFKRSFAATVTPGFEGFVYAKIHLAHNAATPVSVYVDPKIVVT